MNVYHLVGLMALLVGSQAFAAATNGREARDATARSTAALAHAGFTGNSHFGLSDGSGLAGRTVPDKPAPRLDVIGGRGTGKDNGRSGKAATSPVFEPDGAVLALCAAILMGMIHHRRVKR